MNTFNSTRLAKLQCTFPKLTEEDQQYVFGLAEGLRYAQNKSGEIPEKKSSQDSRQREVKG
jgi:hypothetical protein